MSTTIEKVLTREETLGRFLYKRRDSTSTICLPGFLKIKTNKKLVADIIVVNNNGIIYMMYCFYRLLPTIINTIFKLKQQFWYYEHTITKELLIWISKFHQIFTSLSSFLVV